MEYWKRYITAPFSVVRPKQGENKGFYDIRDEQNPNIGWLWIKIILATIEGRLGHYSGLSPKKDRICVHFANPYEEMQRIDSQLKQLGVNYMEFVTIHEENDLNMLTPVTLMDGRIQRIQHNTGINWGIFWGTKIDEQEKSVPEKLALLLQSDGEALDYKREDFVLMADILIYVEIGKRMAAFAAVDNFIKDNYKVGIGCGTTVKHVLERIKAKGLEVLCCPKNFESKQLILEYGLPLTDLNESPLLDGTIDGANEIDIEAKVMIVGGGDGLLSDIKDMAKHSNKLVIIADFTKKSEKLTNNWKKGIPIEVNPKDLESVNKKLGKLFEGKAVLRPNQNDVIDWNFDQKDIYGEENELDGKKGGVDDEEDGVEEEEDGVDDEFDGQSNESKELISKVNLFNESLKKIPGVIETGILTDSDANLTIILSQEFGSFAIQY